MNPSSPAQNTSAPQGLNLPQAPGVSQGLGSQSGPASISFSLTDLNFGDLGLRLRSGFVYGVSYGITSTINFIGSTGEEFIKYCLKQVSSKKSNSPNLDKPPTDSPVTTNIPPPPKIEDSKSLINKFNFINNLNIYTFALGILGVLSLGKGINDIYRNKNKKVAWIIVASAVTEIVVAVYLSRKSFVTKP